MFPIQLQTQIAGGLSLLPPVGSVESNAQAGAMLVQPSDVSVHCIPLDQGQCRVHIHNLSPPVAEANQMELQAQLSSMLCGTGTACGAGGVAPLAVIPHEVIVSSEIAIPNQDRCVLQDGECRAQLQSMFQVHQQPQVVFTTAVSPPVASPAGGAPPAGGVTEAQAQAQSMLVSMTTRAATPQLAQLALDQVNSCTQQVAGAAGALPPRSGSVEAQAQANSMLRFPLAAGLNGCIEQQPITSEQSELNVQVGSMFGGPLLVPIDPLALPATASGDVPVDFGRPCALEAGSECQELFASMFTAQHLPEITEISTISDQPCASYAGIESSSTPDACRLHLPAGGNGGGGHRRAQTGGRATVYVQVHVRATSNADGQRRLTLIQNCIARHAGAQAQLQDCLSRSA